MAGFSFRVLYHGCNVNMGDTFFHFIENDNRKRTVELRKKFQYTYLK